MSINILHLLWIIPIVFGLGFLCLMYQFMNGGRR